MQLSPALGDTAAHPVSLSAVAAKPLDGVAPRPLSFFLLGATGRTGLLFLSQALARGHFVTIYIRNASKLPAAVVSHPHLRTFSGALHEADKITLALRASAPDAVFIMLASERAPHTAVSMGTHSMLLALQEVRDLANIESGAMPLLSIAAWGLGPTAAYTTGRSAVRIFVRLLTALFWAKVSADFNKQLTEIQKAKDAGLVRPILILPPILTNGRRRKDYQSAEASLMKNTMGFTRFVSRASVADLCLKLGEKAAMDEQVPEWVGITNP